MGLLIRGPRVDAGGHLPTQRGLQPEHLHLACSCCPPASSLHRDGWVPDENGPRERAGQKLPCLFLKLSVFFFNFEINLDSHGVVRNKTETPRTLFSHVTQW